MAGIPTDASANVHSVSAVGEQFRPGVTTRAAVRICGMGDDHRLRSPARWPGAGRRQPWISSAAQKTGSRRCYEGVGGRGRAGILFLNRLASKPQAIATMSGRAASRTSTTSSSVRRLSSIVQVNSTARSPAGANLNTLAARAAQTDPAVQSILANAAPTADQVNATFSDVRVVSRRWRLKGRNRYAQALPQRRAGVGVLAAVRRDHAQSVAQSSPR